MMDLATFEDALDRYGADLSAWPAATRLAADPLLAASPAARAARADAAAVEDVLRASRLAPATGADAMAARAMVHRQARPIPLVARRAGWAAAAGVALFFGLYIGDAASRRDDGGESVIAASFDPVGPVDVD